jgi:hypothetical protein
VAAVLRRARPWALTLAGVAAAALQGCAVAAAAPATRDPLTVAEVAALRPAEGEILVRGWVVYAYACPACPPGVQCKPCMDDNVVLSDERRRVASYQQVRPDEVVVFAPSSAGLVVGERYTMRVRVLPRRTTSAPMNDLGLIALERSP